MKIENQDDPRKPDIRGVSLRSDTSSPPIYSQEPQRSSYRLPGILARMVGTDNFHEVPDSPGRRRFEVPVVNTVGEYDLVAQEDSTFITLGAELARIKSEPPVEFYQAINDLNCALPEAKVVCERDVVGEAGNSYDSIQITKQFRKRGMPESVVIAELSSFDAGVKHAAIDTYKAVDKIGLRLNDDARDQVREIGQGKDRLKQLEEYFRERSTRAT